MVLVLIKVVGQFKIIESLWTEAGFASYYMNGVMNGVMNPPS
jgi:hypothetical protein